jgi:nucleotide-binding universal stress UspA family protein
MLKKILVPLDGSILAQKALAPAMDLARPVHGKVFLVSASVTEQLEAVEAVQPPMLSIEAPYHRSHETLTSYLQTASAAYAHPDVTIQAEVVPGDPASVIVDTAEAEDVDLIVMSTHGRTGLSRWVLGSVAVKVLRCAPCPVLVVRGTAAFARVLITLDGSPLSEQALEPGLEVARLLGSSISLMSVEPYQELDSRLVAELEKVERGLGGQATDDFYHRIEAYLDRIARKHQPEMEQKIRIAPRAGRVAPAILNYVESEGIGLIVMATHGRTGLQRWAYGSVTEKVLRRAKCSMLIVRPTW